ncbi:MAG: hypothetical protein AB1758_34765 [Candidatus Eremiobacterota bacterium]
MDPEFFSSCARDRDFLLERLRLDASVPALVVEEVVDRLGLPCPEFDGSETGPRRRCELAHRLAEARLTADAMRERVEVYARIFLLPRTRLLACPGLEEVLRPRLRRERWRRVTVLASAWGVTPALMTLRLRDVGVDV